MRTRSLERSAPWSQPSGRRSLRGGPYPARGRGLPPRHQAFILILAWRDRFLDRCNLSSTILGSNVRQSRVFPPTLHSCSLRSSRHFRRAVHFLGGGCQGASVPAVSAKSRPSGPVGVRTAMGLASILPGCSVAGAVSCRRRSGAGVVAACSEEGGLSRVGTSSPAEPSDECPAKIVYRT